MTGVLWTVIGPIVDVVQGFLFTLAHL